MIEAKAQEYAFGTFRMLPERRLLLSGATPVRLGSRAFDLLQVLVERRGELVAKDELVSRVWPDTFVDETNLRVHVAALRRALGEGGREQPRFLANEPGRGYRFVAAVDVLATEDAATDEPQPHGPTTAPLPMPLVRVVGRDEIVATLAQQLPRSRMLTIVGPAGIGKTTVAVMLAETVASAYADGVHHVDLSVVDTSDRVPGVVATTLGLPVHTEGPTSEIVSHLAQRRVLLLLDGCDSVLDGVAALSEAIVRAASGVHIVATTREPLRTEGERVVRLPALDLPLEQVTTADAAMLHSAVALFAERAEATVDGFLLTDDDAPLVAEICRRLDGIPLAIELAAGRIDAFGVQGVADLLKDRFRLLTGGRRRALPRHQTLAAALDWSHDLLSDDQAMLFRRLAVFSGGFGLDAVIEIAAAGESWHAETPMLVASLVAKSLLAADVSGTITVYRMLDTTRAYGLRKLEEAGETHLVSRRHADFNRTSLLDLERRWLARAVSEAEAQFRLRVDNVRAALDWCFTPGGDAELGAALTAAAVLMWLHLSLVDECRMRVERAIELTPRADDPASRQRDMQLYAALGLSLMFTRGAVADSVAAALRRTLELAESLGNSEYILRALWGLWVGRLNNGAIPESLQLARRFAEVAQATPDPVDDIIADRMVGFSLHFLGENAEARRALERMLAGNPGHRVHSHSYRFQFDLWATARATLAESLWLQGFPDQALAEARAAVAHAESIGHAMTTCNTLAKATAVALHVGDDDLAARMIADLRSVADAHALLFWRAEGACLEGVRKCALGQLDDGLALLGGHIHAFPGNALTVRYVAYVGTLADALSVAGRHEEAAATLAEALGRCERNSELWCLAELLRIKGDILIRSGARADESDAAYRASLELSRRQGAIAWELRTCMSLVRLWNGTPRSDESLTTLRSVRSTYTEGESSLDLRTADLLLARHS